MFYVRDIILGLVLHYKSSVLVGLHKSLKAIVFSVEGQGLGSRLNQSNDLFN